MSVHAFLLPCIQALIACICLCSHMHGVGSRALWVDCFVSCDLSASVIARGGFDDHGSVNAAVFSVHICDVVA